MSKRLVLFSQPSPTVWERLQIELFPDFLKKRMFAYMPSDGSAVEANAQFTPIWQKFLNDNNSKFVFIDNSKTGPEAEKESEKILSSDILMITGGNTYKLLDLLRKSGLDKTIIKFWQQDNVVISGFSAGAIILTPSIDSAKAYDLNEVKLTDTTGLGIVDFEVWPHYEPSQEQEITEFKSKRQVDLKLISNEEVVVIDK